MKFEFTKTIGVDTPAGKTKHFAAGDVIDHEEIHSGCLESCLRTGTIRPFDESAPLELDTAEDPGEATDPDEDSDDVGDPEGEEAGGETKKAKGKRAKK